MAEDASGPPTAEVPARPASGPSSKPEAPAAFASAVEEATAEWPAKAADAVDAAVGAIHDKALRPLFLAARAVVFGLVAAVVAAVVVSLGVVGLIRLLTVYAFPGRVWASYALVGFVLCLGGALLWTRRGSRGRPDS